MEFSFEQPRPRPQSAGGMNNTDQAVGSDRLRKAIERNRAKQAKRSSQSSARGNTSGRGQSEKNWSLPKSNTKAPRSSSASTRRSVGKAGEQEFTTELRKRGPRSQTSVSYSTTTAAATTSVPARARKKLTTVKSLGTSGKTKRKRSKKLAATNEYIIKGIWVFCALLFVRLIVSDGGVMDFYAQHEVLQGRFDEQARIEKQNVALVKEIELLKKNPHYQKKVVRDHLGYIAADEYLILFPES